MVGYAVKKFSAILALLVAFLGLPASPAQAAQGACWVEASAPYVYKAVNGNRYVSGSVSNHCYPPGTVSTLRMTIQKRKCFVWCYWSNILVGSTIHALPGTLDMQSVGTVRYQGSGAYRIYASGSALNVASPIGGVYGKTLYYR